MAAYGELGQDTALDMGLVDEFQATLNNLQRHQVYNLPDLTGYLNHRGKHRAPEIRLADGMFLDRSQLSAPPGAPEAKPEGFGFILKRALRVGREMSRNKVFMGEVTADWLEHDHSDSLDVAVKPLVNRKALLGELAMLQYLKSMEIPTFQPTGFIFNKKASRSHLLTEFQGPVETIDTWDWKGLSIGEQWEMFGYSVETAAMLNSNLLFHRDLQPRNIATDDRNRIVIVDPEFTVSALELADMASTTQDETVQVWATGEIKNLMSYELAEICNSAYEYIFESMPGDERPASIMDEFKEYEHHILKPYKDALIRRNPKYLPVLLDAYELTLVERRELALNPTGES
jgi:hypothetical protein